MKLKNLKYTVTSTAIFLVIILLLGELISRTLGTTLVYKYDPILGWRPKKNFSKKIPVVDLSGEKYYVNYSTNEFGFREFGDLNSKKKRILFVGDSCTGDPYTSDEDAYFGIVGKELPVEVFAIGGGGYGTLQELMLIKEFAGMINPDILVLQYSFNDITNNSFFLEGPSITRNQKNLRPYWIDNRVVYRLSSNNLYTLLYKNFRLFRTLDGLFSNIQYKIYKGYYPPQYQTYANYTLDPSIKLQPEISAQKAAAISITQFLMSEIAQNFSTNTKLITFSGTADSQEELRIWQTLARNAGFIAYTSVSANVENAERKGAIVRIKDGAHWNRLGNKIAGETLAQIIQRDLL